MNTISSKENIVTPYSLQHCNSLIVLLVGQFKDSHIKSIFARYFINMLQCENEQEAIILNKNNLIDIILIENKSISNPYDIIETVQKRHKKPLCMIASKELNTQDLLMSIDLKVDAHLLEYDEEHKLYEQINESIIKYTNNKHEELFTEAFPLRTEDLLISKTNPQGIITYCNKSFCQHTGYNKEELIGQNHNILRHKNNSRTLFKKLWKTIKEDKKSWSGIIKNITKQKKAFYAQSTIIPILNKNNEILEYLSLRIDISQQFSDKSKLKYCIKNSDLSVLAIIQIEDFDVMSDLYSQKLLTNIEQSLHDKLLDFIHKKEIFHYVYSLGEGQYALHCDFYHFLKKNINMQYYFQELVNHINNSSFNINSLIKDIQIALSFSYGKENLFKDANKGIQKALSSKNEVFDSNDIYIKENSNKKENIDIMKTIKVALDNSNIISHFQPIINNKTLNIEKYESLVRLIDEDDNILAPNAFLDVSKNNHYYSKITYNVLKNSFKMLKHIEQDISINICMSDIEKKETMNKLFKLLDENKEYTHRLVIELLENENRINYNHVQDFISCMKDKGVKIAIDDFGAGYSNFERLMTFQPDIIKIDGSLIKNIEHDSFSRNLVESISFLSKKQNIMTIAEYVENENIYNILTEIGIDYSQGYYFGKPQGILVE